MVLSANEICKQVDLGNSGEPTGIAVIPSPDLDELRRGGESSVNLRLGRWFLTLKQSRRTHLEIIPGTSSLDSASAKSSFVPFGHSYILHPNRFVLGSTLEWIRIPQQYSAFVVGKSRLGRRGIIIETAAGVHPGFSGCVTLEIANIGEVPVELIAGMSICQLFFHPIQGVLAATATSLAGQRKPRLGELRADPVLDRLVKTKG